MPDERQQLRSRRLQHSAVLGVLLLVVAWRLAPAWELGMDRAVPFGSVATSAPLGEGQQALRRADLTFYTWLTARNARTLVTNPLGIFDAENCAPSENTLALSAPGLTLGLLGIPALALSHDPIVTYNLVVAAMLLLAGLAMYLLILEWTGSAAAGLSAGLLYAFHVVRIDRLLWIAEVDTTWTVLALLLSRRLFASGRSRDAVLLGVVCCLQMVTSFYSFLASAVLGACFLAWLLRTYGLEHVQKRQLLLLGSFLAVFAALLFTPYFELRAAGNLFERDFRAPLPLSAYLPGGPFFLGFTVWALVLVAFFKGKLGLRGSSPEDPRWAVGAGGLVVMILAAGWSLDYQLRELWPGLPFEIPDFFHLLAQLLPGLENVRVISLMGAGVHLSACVLAGIGAAALIRLAGRQKNLAQGFVLGLAAVDILAPPIPGFTAGGSAEGLDIRPSNESIGFFEQLGETGPPGWILELPFDHGSGTTVKLAPERILLSFYHRRRTSACYSAYPPRGRAALARSVETPLDAEALRVLQDQGFGLIVLHQPDRAKTYAGDFRRLSLGPEPALRPVLETPDRIAYALVPRASKTRSAKPRRAHQNPPPMF
ncbi:MAG: hypothetical protein NZ990_07250 [Myxococcota bacterium]|nr:hypothetical protein [Myxococcota bacterium]